MSDAPYPTVEVRTYRLELVRRKVSQIGVGVEQLRILQEEVAHIVELMADEADDD